MKIKKQKKDEPIKLEMTPMIDVTFQLLTFFIMTFKVVSEEGDFNIKMPVGASGAPMEASLPPLHIKLTAGADGELAQIKLGENVIPSFDALQQQVLGMVRTDTPTASSDLEAELDCDYDLKYTYVMDAINAVAGQKQKDGAIRKLIEKVKFAPPKQEKTE